MVYPIVIVKLSKKDGGGYAGYAVDLPGCMSDGETPQEALKNTTDAIGEWIDAAKKLRRKVPQPGSAVHRAKEERAAIVKSFKEAAKLLESLDEKVEKLAKDMQEIQETQSNNESWLRFADVTGVQPIARRGKRLAGVG